MSSRRQFFFRLGAAAAFAPRLVAAKGQYLVYIGTYTNNQKSKGIYVLRFDSSTGRLGNPEVAAEVANPSFLTIHPNRKYLYAIGELYDRQKGGAVTSFSIDSATGKLTQLNQVASQGGGPCHLVVDKTGNNLLVVNYGTGSSAVFRIGVDGKLSEATSVIQHSGSSANPRRQQGPHAHSVNMAPDNRFAIVADLGLDQVIVYRFDPAQGKISPNDPPYAKVAPGAGPRHFAFHPKGRHAYVINEMGSSITAFSWNAQKGVLTEVQTISTLPQGFQGENNCAEVVVHPSGRFVYGSNRGHNSIAVFSVDQATGKLTAVEQPPTQGRTPRNFNIDPTGKWLIAANQQSDNLVVFSIDARTGKLTPTGQTVEIGLPVCVKFLAL